MTDGFEIDSDSVRSYASGPVASRVEQLRAAADQVHTAKIQPDVPFLIADVGPRVEESLAKYAEALKQATEGQLLHQLKIVRIADIHDEGELSAVDTVTKVEVD